MGDTKKAIKQEIKAIYKNVLKDLTEEEQKLTSEEKLELREYIEELSEGHISSFVPTFIRKKIREIIHRHQTDDEHKEKGEIFSLVDDDISPVDKNALQKYHDLIQEKTKELPCDYDSLCTYREGFISGLFHGNLISEKEMHDLHAVFAPESNYYVEDGEVKTAEQ